MKLKLFFVGCMIIRSALGQETQDRVIVDMDPSVDRLFQRSAKGDHQPISLKDTDPCLAAPKKRGYKIQIFSTKDRKEAQEQLKRLIDIYPDFYPELKFENPDYKVQLGNYLYISSYEDDLQKIRQKHPYAFPVRAYVWCKRAR